MRPIVGGGIHGGKFVGDSSAELAVRFPAHDINRGAPGHFVKPGGENRVGLQFICAAREVGENGLRHFFGQLRRVGLAQCRRENQIQMTTDQRREGILRIVLRVALQQLQTSNAHFKNVSPTNAGIRQRIFCQWRGARKFNSTPSG